MNMLDMFVKAKDRYNSVCLNGYQLVSEVIALGEIYGSKALKTLSIGGLCLLPISCNGNENKEAPKPVEQPKSTIEIPYNTALKVKQIRESPFFKPDGTLDLVKISLNVGDVVGKDKKEDAVVFTVNCLQQLRRIKENLQSEDEVYVVKGEGKFCPDPDRITPPMDFPVTMLRGKNGEYLIDVSDPDKYLRFTGTGVSEVTGVDVPELKNGSISPKKILNPVTRRSQRNYYHRGQR